MRKISAPLFAVFVVALFMLLPTFVDNPYYLRIVLMIAMFSLLGLGLNYLFGYTGQISIGHAAFYAIGAYVSAILETKFKVHFLIAWIVALVIAGLVAYLISFPILKLKGHYLAMATLAFGLIMETFLAQWRSLTGGHDGIMVMTSSLLGVWLKDNLYYFVVGSTILAFLFVHNLTRSSVGRAHKALRDDEDAAETLGIAVRKHKVFAFVLSAVFAALAGIWYAHISKVITPEVFTLHTSIQILMMVVIGGLASNVGSVLGAAFIIVLPEFLHDFREASTFIYGLIVLAVLIFFPKGIMGLFQHAFHLIMKVYASPNKPVIEKGGETDVHGG